MPRRSPRRTAMPRILAIGVAALLGIALQLTPIAPATAPAEAATATGGTGLYKGVIDWIQWGTTGQTAAQAQIANGQVATSTRTVGSSTLVTTCTISSISASDGAGSIYAYRSGSWSGDALDDSYNQGGAGSANQMVYGISNKATGSGSNDGTMSFTVGCVATLDGAAVPLRGLVIADAEQNNHAAGQDEAISAKPATAATWRLVERSRTSGCTTDAQASVASDNTLTLRSTAAQCTGSPGGPIAIAFMDGASQARFGVMGQNGSASAIAIGAVVATDFGDAPASYGAAGSIFQTSWTGGALAAGTTTLAHSASLAQIATPVRTLGATIDADPAYVASTGANADDTAGSDDEDALFSYSDASGGAVTGATTLVAAAERGMQHSTTITCRGTGAVRGWIDWNRDGDFADANDASASATCGTGGTAALTWTVPADATSGASFIRLRIGAVGSTLAPTGLTTDGEVEDHAITIALPSLTVAKTSTPPFVQSGQAIAYTVTMTNGPQRVTSPRLVDDLTAVLANATYTTGSASATVNGVASAAPVYSAAGRSLTWTGTAPLAPGAVVVMTFSVTAKDAGRGQTFANTVAGTATSMRGVELAASASVSNQVAVAVAVDKRWVVNGAAAVADGQQPAGLSASLTVTTPGTTTATPLAWGALRDGYTVGATPTIAETTRIAPEMSGCRLVSSTMATASGTVLATSTTGVTHAPTLGTGVNRYVVTNVVTCDTMLTLVKVVEGGSAQPGDWSLTASTTPASPASGTAVFSTTSGIAHAVTPNAVLQLGEAGPATYAQVDSRTTAQRSASPLATGSWTCSIVDGGGAVVAGVAFADGVDGTVAVPFGSRISCAATNQTATMTVLKLVDGDATFAPADFDLTATPATFDGLSATTAVGDQGVTAANTFPVRPAHPYSLTESGTVAHLQIDVQRYTGTVAADGSVDHADASLWQSVDPAAVTVAPGEHAIYRIVNAPVASFFLPLTGGASTDMFVAVGLGVLLAAMLAVGLRLAVSRRRIRMRATAP